MAWWFDLGSSTVSIDSCIVAQTQCMICLSKPVARHDDSAGKCASDSKIPTWITCKRPMAFYVYPRYNGQALPDLPDGFALLEGLRRSLWATELWTQLGLDLVEPGPTLDASPTVHLRLHHVHATAATKHPAARFLREAPFADVQPPNGVAQYLMDTVQLNLDIERASEPRRAGGRARGNDRADAELDADMLDAPQLSLDTLVKAANAGLRLAIATGVPRMAKSVRLVADARRHSLESLAPAVWRAGYLQDVAERACYVPTISKALCSRAKRGAARPGLPAVSDEQACAARLWGIMGEELGQRKRVQRLGSLEVVAALAEEDIWEGEGFLGDGGDLAASSQALGRWADDLLEDACDATDDFDMLEQM